MKINPFHILSPGQCQNRFVRQIFSAEAGLMYAYMYIELSITYQLEEMHLTNNVFFLVLFKGATYNFH